MKACVIENGIVVNVIEVASVDDLATFNALDLGEYAEIGDTVVDGASVEAASRVPTEEDLLNERKAIIREQRNELLKETDWWAVSDRTMTQEQIDYRQALRDLPDQDGFPDVDFPVIP